MDACALARDQPLAHGLSMPLIVVVGIRVTYYLHFLFAGLLYYYCFALAVLFPDIVYLGILF